MIKKLFGSILTYPQSPTKHLGFTLVAYDPLPFTNGILSWPPAPMTKMLLSLIVWSIGMWFSLFFYLASLLSFWIILHWLAVCLDFFSHPSQNCDYCWNAPYFSKWAFLLRSFLTKDNPIPRKGVSFPSKAAKGR